MFPFGMLIMTKTQASLTGNKLEVGQNLALSNTKVQQLSAIVVLISITILDFKLYLNLRFEI